MANQILAVLAVPLHLSSIQSSCIQLFRTDSLHLFFLSMINLYFNFLSNLYSLSLWFISSFKLNFWQMFAFKLGKLIIVQVSMVWLLFAASDSTAVMLICTNCSLIIVIYDWLNIFPFICILDQILFWYVGVATYNFFLVLFT